MRFIVPQNITLEDKVIGPFTLKQFFYLLAGGMLGYVAYTIVAPSIGTTGGLVAALPAVVIALTFTFIRINDQPFMVFIAAVIGHFTKPRMRRWQRLPSQPLTVSQTRPPVTEPEKKERQAGKDDLARLAQLVDSQGWSKDQLGARVVSSAEAKQQLHL